MNQARKTAETLHPNRTVKFAKWLNQSHELDSHTNQRTPFAPFATQVSLANSKNMSIPQGIIPMRMKCRVSIRPMNGMGRGSPTVPCGLAKSVGKSIAEIVTADSISEHFSPDRMECWSLLFGHGKSLNPVQPVQNATIYRIISTIVRRPCPAIPSGVGPYHSSCPGHS